MSSLSDRLRSWLSGGWPKPFVVSPSSLAILGSQIAMTETAEYDCADVYRLLDQLAEAVLRGEDTAPWMPLIRSHLERCPDCRAEFEALMRTLRTAEA